MVPYLYFVTVSSWDVIGRFTSAGVSHLVIGSNTTNIRVANWAVGVADVGEGATRRLIAVEADKFI